MRGELDTIRLQLLPVSHRKWSVTWSSCARVFGKWRRRSSFNGGLSRGAGFSNGNPLKSIANSYQINQIVLKHIPHYPIFHILYGQFCYVIASKLNSFIQSCNTYIGTHHFKDVQAYIASNGRPQNSHARLCNTIWCWNSLLLLLKFLPLNVIAKTHNYWIFYMDLHGVD